MQFLNICYLVARSVKRLAAGESVLGIRIPDSRHSVNSLVFFKSEGSLILTQYLVLVQLLCSLPRYPFTVYNDLRNRKIRFFQYLSVKIIVGINTYPFNDH